MYGPTTPHPMSRSSAALF
jgi:hypothetical protein